MSCYHWGRDGFPAAPNGGGVQDFVETAAELENIIEKGTDEMLRHACPEYFKE
ncbi:MAG: hypothetical protein H8D34_33270 [Chloroflexi bacterium]|nr:hypothetical protein [Chloroflexota bacterium]